MPAQVRLAAPDDAEGITRVHIAGWRWAYPSLLPADYLASLADDLTDRISRRREQLARRRARNPTFVAVDDTGAVVGFVNLGRYRNDQRFDDLADGIGEVYAIYLTHEVAGTGTGRALMDAAVAWSREHGLAPVRLWVLEGNTRALAFYQRYGFRLDGIRSRFILARPGGTAIDLPEVRLSLAVGDTP